ncbi:MAG: hypothetical protein KF812_11055 [Fimbriimonadaceae bacterium]|nr:hypothetical protein [Fimbriimonadaceae bacterium]
MKTSGWFVLALAATVVVLGCNPSETGSVSVGVPADNQPAMNSVPAPDGASSPSAGASTSDSMNSTSSDSTSSRSGQPPVSGGQSVPGTGGPGSGSATPDSGGNAPREGGTRPGGPGSGPGVQGGPGGERPGGGFGRVPEGADTTVALADVPAPKYPGAKLEEGDNSIWRIKNDSGERYSVRLVTADAADKIREWYTTQLTDVQQNDRFMNGAYNGYRVMISLDERTAGRTVIRLMVTKGDMGFGGPGGPGGPGGGRPDGQGGRGPGGGQRSGSGAGGA